jgi:hypothetical protein
MFKLPKLTSSNVVIFLFVSNFMEFSTCDVSFGRQFQMLHEKGDVNDVW